MERDKGALDDTLDAAAASKPSDGVTVVEARSNPGGLVESWPTSTGAGDIDSPMTRYRLEGVIGRGGMGEVVSARDDQIGRSVAIKRMRGDDPPAAAVARFLREARIQGRLEHPAVVPVHELWHDAQNNPFFVMKQLSGTPLSDVISKIAAGGPLARENHSRQRLLRAFADICLAIEFAHTRGVIHRDLKPANIMLGDFGEVYVLDWGIAKVAGELATRASFADIEAIEGEGTQAGSLLGTPGYMSPEQLRGDVELDGRSDVYALGCILFELVTLQPLHELGAAWMQSVLLGVEARPSVRVPDRETPPELDAICLAATMLDRDVRYATARELGAAVERFLDGDRDLALRKKLAEAELAEAAAALERGNGAAERRAAMRSAARALALDPTSPEPADLVGRLMLEPPAVMPPEVGEAIDQQDRDQLYAGRYLFRVAGLSLLGFLPIVYLTGIRDPWIQVVGVAVCFGILTCGLLTTRANVVVTMRLALSGCAAMVCVYARLATPFLVAPCIAAICVVVAVNHPKIGRPWTITIAFIAAVLVPWLFEVTRVASTTHFEGNLIILSTPAVDGLDPVITMGALVLYVVFAISICSVVSVVMTRARLTAQRAVEIQKWQLQQLMPRSARVDSVAS